MKKTTLSIFAFLIALFQFTDLKAQHTFTADLELIFRDTTRYIIVNPEDTVHVNFAVVNHGPDNIDTSNYVLYSMTTVPSNYFFVVQTEDGLPFIGNGDTVDSRGVTFTHGEIYEEDEIESYCYFLRTRDDADSFIYDPNLTNDTICFHVVYKANPPSSIGKIEQLSNLKISPNPATDLVNIPVDAFKHQHTTIKVLSVDGRLMQQQEVPSNGSGNLSLNVSTWPKGIYFVNIQSDKKRSSGKFIVR